MHTEGQIRAAIRPLIEMYGELTTSEIKQQIEEVLILDDDDKIKSETRNEILILQRIGNIVAHQSEEVKIYDEGFIVDKSFRPAKFIAIKGINQEKVKISDNEIRKRKRAARRIETERKVYKKINWNLENERRTALGQLGEEFVLDFEKEKVKNIDSSSVERVIHLSVLQGDGFGYDILSLNELGEPIYIEVKTTVKSEDTPFFMSKNEKSFFEQNTNVWLYRVYDFNLDSRHGKIKMISSQKLLENYNFDPITFMVSKKQN